MKHDEALDRAIDQVARDLTEAVPRHGFASRVRERIERPRRSGAWAWQLAGALTVLALVMYVAWPVEKMPAGEIVDRTTADTPTRSEPRLDAPPETAPLVRSLARTSPARTHSARAPWEQRMVPRIPIDSEAPQIEAIPELGDLTLHPIEIAELTIAPLEPEKESR